MILEFMNAKFWVMISTFVCVGFLYSKAWPFVIDAIDERIKRIKNRLEEAELTRGEAQQILSKFQRQYRDAMTEVESVLSDAKIRSGQMRTQALANLGEEISRIEQNYQDRMMILEQEMINDVRNEITQNIIKLIEKKVLSQKTMASTQLTGEMKKVLKKVGDNVTK